MRKTEDRDKYFRFPIDFKTEEQRDNFKNYVRGLKEAFAKPIYETVTEMLELHKEKTKRERVKK